MTAMHCIAATICHHTAQQDVVHVVLWHSMTWCSVTSLCMRCSMLCYIGQIRVQLKQSRNPRFEVDAHVLYIALL